MISLLTFLGFTALVGAITWWLTRGDEHGTSEGYFLAGRTLTGGFIAGSLMLTNLSTEQLVGLNGAAFTDGLSVMAWEVVAGVALVAMALWFLPRFLRSGITTIPEFLEARFGPSTRMISTLIFLLAYTLLLLPLILYTGARGLSSMLDVQGLLGLESDTAALWVTVWVVGALGSAYAIFGGLRTVVVSDTINGFGLLIGGVLVAALGLSAVATACGGEGIWEGFQTLRAAQPEKFNSIGSPEQSVPFSTLFTGVLLLNLFYWCTNQQIIQRTLGARTLAEGQRGVLLAGFMKLLGPLILVLPGLIAFDLYRRGVLELPIGENGAPRTDFAYGNLVQHVLPGALTGFFAAVMVGAILSSFNSALNSTATLFSLGIYKGVIAKDATNDRVVRSGRFCGIAVAIFAMCAAPALADQGEIFGHLQAMNAIYFIPLLAVILTGMLDRTASERAANVALIFSLVVMIGGSLQWKEAVESHMNMFHFMGIVFVSTMALLFLLGLVWPRKERWVHEHSGDVDLVPWRFAKPVSLVLIASVLLIYVSFAG